MSDAFQQLSQDIGPSVVQIFVSGFGAPTGLAADSNSLIPRKRGTGSGVILDASGYIVTNFHVVEGAQRVQVLLNPLLDRRDRGSILKGSGQMIGAQIVGVDPETDLAVLKIEATDLPALTLADSDELGPGEIVLAFGSPLGLENSVTMGIVSSVARQLRPEDPMIYIQTDSAINPGNSGGPLVNTLGQVVGINTLIFSQGGGSEGIGFAAPSNIVRNVYEQIREFGRVRRGFIGVHAQSIDRSLERGLGLSQGWGVVLGDVIPGGPGHLSGLQPGDVVVSLDGKTMENGRQFEINLYGHAVGDVVTLQVMRGSEAIEKRVPVIERSNDPLRFSSMVTREKNLIPKLGILGIEVSEQLKKQYLPGLRKDTGVLVAAMSADAPTWKQGFRPGDVIYSVNGQPVVTLTDLRSIVDKERRGASLAVQVERAGGLLYVGFELD